MRQAVRRPAREQREIEARNRNIAREHERGNVDHGNSCRHEIALLAPAGCVGLEAGVDTGQFTERLWGTGQFKAFHAVDKWDDIAHAEAQYWAAAKKLMPYEEIRIWRMTAQIFSSLAPKGHFGFIYMDCYAHTAQDDGGVLNMLWALLQDGGLFAGDDYDAEAWPDNFKAVNEFASSVGRQVKVFDKHLNDDRPKYDTYASWYFIK